VLGAIGINIATRLMGLVLAAIGFDIMGEGVRTLLGLGH
jgi:small neutral amino acid transporter SnatA (MarC family)